MRWTIGTVAQSVDGTITALIIDATSTKVKLGSGQWITGDELSNNFKRVG